MGEPTAATSAAPQQQYSFDPIPKTPTREQCADAQRYINGRVQQATGQLRTSLLTAADKLSSQKKEGFDSSESMTGTSNDGSIIIAGNLTFTDKKTEPPNFDKGTQAIFTSKIKPPVPGSPAHKALVTLGRNECRQELDSIEDTVRTSVSSTLDSIQENLETPPPVSVTVRGVNRSK